MTAKRIGACLVTALWICGMLAITASAQTREPSLMKAGLTDNPPHSDSADDTMIDDSYFDNAVFVGDSISLQLKKYVAGQRGRKGSFLGNAQFLTRGGLGSGNAQEPVSAASLHPAYQGQKMQLEDSVAATGADKVYIMFGMNDIGLYGVDASVENFDLLLEKIRAKSPEARIIVQSVTPILAGRQRRVLNNANIELYNQKLEALCREKGYDFLDVGSIFQGEDGSLLPQYCGDAGSTGIHLSESACEPWIDYLRANPIHEDAANLDNPAQATEVAAN